MLNLEKKPPCRVCMSLRLFLMAVLAIVLMTIINRDVLSFIGNFSISAIATTFIIGFGLLSLLKAVFDYIRIDSE